MNLRWANTAAHASVVVVVADAMKMNVVHQHVTTMAAVGLLLLALVLQLLEQWGSVVAWVYYL